MKRTLLFWAMAIAQAAAGQTQDLSKLSYAQLDSLTDIEYEKGSYDLAIPYVEIGREKARKEFGDQDSTYAAYTGDLGFYYREMGEYKKAETFALEAVRIYEKAVGEKHESFIIALGNLAHLYHQMGEYEKAESLYKKVIKLYQQTLGNEHPSLAMAWGNLASMYLLTGEYEKAEPLLLQAQQIRAKTLGEQHPDYAIALSSLSDFYQDLGNYEKAEPLLLQAKSIFAKELGEQHPYYTTTLNNLALLYQLMGKYEKAEPLLLQCKKIESETLGEQHPDFAIGLNNLAAVYKSLGKYEKAEEYYIQAQKILVKALGKQHPEYAKNLNNLAVLYQSMNRYAQAEPLLLQALALRIEMLGEQHPSAIRSTSNLANLYRLMGRLDTAMVYCKKSIINNCKGMDSDFSDWSRLDQFHYFSNDLINHSLRILSDIFELQYQKTGDKNKLASAYQVAQAAMHINERIRNSFSGESDKLRSLATNSEFLAKTMRTGLQLANKDHEQALFGFAEMNKGVLLMDAAKTARAYKFGFLPDSLANEEKELQKKYSSLQAKLLEKRPKEEKDSLQAKLNSLNQEIEAFTQMLKQKYPKYAAIKYENKSAGIGDIQAILSDKTALLEYILSDSVLYVFYVDKQQVRVSQTHIIKEKLNKQIERLQESLSNYQLASSDPKRAYREYSQAAHWAYQTLLAPSLKNAVGIEHLVIIPDGGLGHLPFESFLVEPAPDEGDYAQLHYLLNDFSISYNYSATLWKENLQSQQHSNNGLILGIAANYNQTSAAKETRLPVYRSMRDVLLPLPAARREVEVLSENFDGYFMFDSLASERSFKRIAHQYGIIHMAMHGVLDKNSPILSSLVFTEDGDSTENNFLQAYEISQMQLNADLVVLSACETGYGKFETGNGTASLARAFMYAGVPALVVSLWEVNDASTSQIMQLFYTNMAAGMDKAEALRQAKIAYIRQSKGASAHPAYWSPFVQIGDSRSINVGKGNGGAWMWWLAAGVLVAIAGAAFAWRMKGR